ncbi:polymeric immunoglobulin receptor-like [Fundulus heteroclitus]|uniref:polymeric immunoglobulin receptor-like n=1 Tax=Fundulus heteroclitus TaxID=8078 RepID=UPI00165A2720|nr:polymeric immunoglobulin receptor-like [Fundulus heteroclitus]
MRVTSGWFQFYVRISGLTQSDSGRYRCGLGDSLSSVSYQDFRLVVVDALLDGNKDHHVYKEAGSSLTVACSFGSSGKTKSFCRGGPGEKEVLVQTGGVKDEKGRYSLEYDEQPSGGVLLVTITQLTQSDSGRYRCKLDRTGSTSLDLHVTFRDVDPSVSTPPTTVSIRSTSGSFTPSASSETTNVTQDNTVTSKGASNHSVLMFVGLTLLIIITIFLLLVALLVFCTKQRDKHHKEAPVHAEHSAVTEGIRIYENVQVDDEQWRWVDVDIYSSYGDTMNTKPTAASPHIAKNDSTKATCAAVKHSSRKAASDLKASCGTMAVLYAEPSERETSDDEPLYFNTT